MRTTLRSVVSVTGGRSVQAVLLRTQAGATITRIDTCERCVHRLIENENLTDWRGHPGVKHRSEPVAVELVRRPPLPPDFAANLADFAAMPGQHNEWLLLTYGGRLGVFDAEIRAVDTPRSSTTTAGTASPST